jgi:hypothetical protein
MSCVECVGSEMGSARKSLLSNQGFLNSSALKTPSAVPFDARSI